MISPDLQIILSLLGTGFLNPNPTDKSGKQAGAELGQAQLKLGLDLDSINLN
jgi:hypothetical protein